MSSFGRFCKYLLVFTIFLLCQRAFALGDISRCRCDGAFCACPGLGEEFPVWGGDETCEGYGMRQASLSDTGCSLTSWDCPYARAWGWLSDSYDTAYGLYAGMSLRGLGLNRKNEKNWVLCVRKECDECLLGDTLCENSCNPTACGEKVCTGNDICCNGECKSFCRCFPESSSCTKCANVACHGACEVCDGLTGTCKSKCAAGTSCCNGQCYDKNNPPTPCHQWNEATCSYEAINCPSGKECCNGRCYNKNCEACHRWDENSCSCVPVSNGFTCGVCSACQDGTCTPYCSADRCEVCQANGRCVSTCSDRQVCSSQTCVCKEPDVLGCLSEQTTDPNQNCACVCPADQILNEAGTACVCPVTGQTLNEAGTACVCPTNQILNETGTACVSCPAGQMVNETGTACVPIPPPTGDDDDDDDDVAEPVGDDDDDDVAEPAGDDDDDDVAEPAGDDDDDDVAESAGDDDDDDVAEPAGDDDDDDVAEPAGDDDDDDVAEPVGDDDDDDVAEPVTNGCPDEPCQGADSQCYTLSGLHICGPSGGRVYCSSYYGNGDCMSLFVSPDANCEPYVSSYWPVDDGLGPAVPKTGGCCPGVVYKTSSNRDACCESARQLYTKGDLKICSEILNGKAYCSFYDVNEGVCSGLSVSSDVNCKPYVSSYWSEEIGTAIPKEGGCCSETLYQLVAGETSQGICSSRSDGVVYCRTYYEDGKCKQLAIETTGNAPDITIYISDFYENGNPKTGSACNTLLNELSLFDSPTDDVKLGLCHTKNYYAYCSKYHEQGGCMEAKARASECDTYYTACYDEACDNPNTVACCPEGYQASSNNLMCIGSNMMSYCIRYNEKNVCIQEGTRQAMGLETVCTPVKEDFAGTCIISGETAYCARYDNNGKCIEMGYTSGTCSPYVMEYNETTGLPQTGGCCDGNDFISETRADGTALRGGCCATDREVVSIKKSASENVGNGGLVKACVSAGEIAYCETYSSDIENACTSCGFGSGCTPSVASYWDNEYPNTGICN